MLRLIEEHKGSSAHENVLMPIVYTYESGSIAEYTSNLHAFATEIVLKLFHVLNQQGAGIEEIEQFMSDACLLSSKNNLCTCHLSKTLKFCTLGQLPCLYHGTISVNVALILDLLAFKVKQLQKLNEPCKYSLHDVFIIVLIMMNVVRCAQGMSYFRSFKQADGNVLFYDDIDTSQECDDILSSLHNDNNMSAATSSSSNNEDNNQKKKKRSVVEQFYRLCYAESSDTIDELLQNWVVGLTLEDEYSRVTEIGELK